MIYASRRFVKIFLLNNFDFWRLKFSTEAAGKFFIDIAILTLPLSLVHLPLLLLLVVSFCSWFVHILARVSCCLRSFWYGIFFWHLEFLNSFILVTLILCFSCLFVYLFCVSFPFRWLSLSKVDNLFKFLLALFCLKFLWFFLLWFVVFVRFGGRFVFFD